MAEKKNWFGSLDLAHRFAIVFGSLLLLILILGILKVMYKKIKLKEHLKLVDDEGRESTVSHLQLDMREKDDSELFGVRAIEAGYFAGVAQSANSSPTLTPRVSLGDLSSTFKGPQYARATSGSNAFDPNKHERVTAAHSHDNFCSSPRQILLRPPLSPTTPSVASAIRNTPSTNSPPASPACSPIQVPSTAHIRQIALRPRTAERTSRHNHSLAIEKSNDSLEMPRKTLYQPDILTPPQSPPPEDLKRHARVFSTSDLRSWLNDNEVPQLHLPDFIGSSEVLIPEFDDPESKRTPATPVSTTRECVEGYESPELKSKKASMVGIFSTPARMINQSSPASPEDILIADQSAPLTSTRCEEKHSNREAIVPERFFELPAATEGPRPPIPSVIVEGGRFYFDHSKSLTLALPVRAHLSPATTTASLQVKSGRAPQLAEDLGEDDNGNDNVISNEPLTCAIPSRSPVRRSLSTATSETYVQDSNESAPRSSEDFSEDDDGEVTPRASFFALALALPIRSPLRLSPASSRRKLSNDTKRGSRFSEELGDGEDDLDKEENDDNSPRTSFSWEQTLPEYRRESMLAPSSPPRKYRIGDTPMSSLTPHAISEPDQATLDEMPTAESSRRFSIPRAY